MLEIKLNQEWQVAKTDAYNYRLQKKAYNEVQQKYYWQDVGYYPTLKSVLKAHIMQENNEEHITTIKEWITQIDAKLVEVVETMEKLENNTKI